MSKTLLVCFDDVDAGHLSAFGVALGGDVEFVKVSPTAVADAVAPVIATAAAGCTHVAAISSMAAKDVMARVAGLLDAAMVTDVLSVVSPNQFTRPMVFATISHTIRDLGSI